MFFNYITPPLVVPSTRNPPANAGDLGSIPGVGKIPWRRKWQPTPVSLPGQGHGQRSLWAIVHGVTESDKTFGLNTHTRIHLNTACHVVSYGRTVAYVAAAHRSPVSVPFAL